MAEGITIPSARIIDLYDGGDKYGEGGGGEFHMGGGGNLVS